MTGVQPCLFRSFLLAGWAPVSVGAGLWSIPAGLVTAGALLIALTIVVARLGGMLR